MSDRPPKANAHEQHQSLTVERSTTSLVVAVIGALALVGVLLVALLTSDDAAGLGSAPAPGAPGGTLPSEAVSGDTSGGSNGSAGGGGGVVGVSSAAPTTVGPAVPASHLTKSYLSTHIPVPPGVHKVDPDQTLGNQILKSSEVPLSLAAIQAFYTQKLPALGLRYDAVPCSTNACAADLVLARSSDSVGQLQFNDLPGNHPRGRRRSISTSLVCTSDRIRLVRRPDRTLRAALV